MGKVWCQISSYVMETKLSKSYSRDICKEWIPIFAVDRQFPFLNGTVTCTQIPMKQLMLVQFMAVKEVHSGIWIYQTHQDCWNALIFHNYFMQHKHYVAASPITSSEGLLIISWNHHLISVNKDVTGHIK